MTEKLTVPVCFLMTPSMYEGIQKAAEKRDVKISKLLRQVNRDFLRSEVKSENRPKEDRLTNSEERKEDLQNEQTQF
jgi:hypothetical protein